MQEVKEQQTTLNDYIRVLYRGRWIILVSFVVVVAATLYFTLTAKPVYEASALVLLKEEGKMQQQIFEVSSFMKRETMINNQVEILKSRTLAEGVIHKLQKSEYADSLWILGNGPDGGGINILQAVLSLFRKKGGEEEGSAVDRFDGIVKAFREGVVVSPKRDTDMIELKIQSHSPFEAAFVANTWMEAYQELDVSLSRGEVSEVRSFLEKKLEDITSSLRSSEVALKSYKEQNRVVELTAETQQLIQQAAQFQSLYESTKTDLEANEKRLSYLKSQLDESQRAVLESPLSTPQIQEMEKQMAQLMGEIAGTQQQAKASGLENEEFALSQLRPKEEKLKGLQQKIVEEKRKLVSAGMTSLNPMAFSEAIITSILELETENSSLKVKTQELGKVVQRYNRELNGLPEKGLRLAELQREAEVRNNLYMMLSEKYEENRIMEAGQIGQVRIVDRAKPPKYPISPKKKMNLLLGIMIGLGLGVGLTFLREYLDTSLKSMEDVEAMGFSVLGSIPVITPQQAVKHIKGHNGEVQHIESRLITHFAPKSPISEAYRTLRTNIQYTHVDEPAKSVLISSAGPGEGKSTSVANLAIAMAQTGAKTVLVDTDLRRPVLHGIFGVSRSEGLTNVLVGKIDLKNAVKPTKIENLDLITSGPLPPNPSELLASKAMEKFIDTVKKTYDIAFFDSPPVIAVTDSAVLATKLDGVVLVMKSGETQKDALLRAKQLLDNVNAHLLGVLINGVTVSSMYGSYYYYYHYYYDGDGKHKTRKSRKLLA